MAYWLDDGFDTWPEIAKAGTPAAGLYSRCGSWIARNIGNGRVADAIVPAEVARMYGTVEWAQRLVDANLWAVEGDRYRDLRYFDLNPTLAKVRENKERKAAAGRKGGLASGNSRRTNQTRSRTEAGASAGASRLVEPPSLPPPSTKGEGGVRPRSAQGAAHAPTGGWDEAPQFLAEEEERMRLAAEAAVVSIAEQQKRAERGAALARAAIPKRPPATRRNALVELRAVTEDNAGEAS